MAYQAMTKQELEELAKLLEKFSEHIWKTREDPQMFGPDDFKITAIQDCCSWVEQEIEKFGCETVLE